MKCFCVKISAVDGMDSSGKYAAVIKLMSTGYVQSIVSRGGPKGMSQQHCTVGMIGHVMKQQTIVLKK